MNRCSLLLLLLIIVTPAGASEWKFGGHAKYRYAYTDYRADDMSALVGDDPARDHAADLRLKAEWRDSGWEAVAHYELLALHGDGVETARRLSTLGVPGGNGLPDDRRRLFDLTHSLRDDGRTAAVHRLDRVSLGYVGEGGVWRAGRQIVSWGNGLVFHPLDFVNPFSPVAVDKDYKTGDDMLFGQRTLAQGGDVQAIVLARRDSVTRDVDGEQATYAAKWRHRFGAIDIDLIGARHFGESLAGIGIVRSVGGAVWRFDACYVDLDRADGAWSWVMNVDYSWTWSGKNIYGYVEFFRNGVGESDRAGYVSPNAALAARVARGELYSLGREYLALGLQVELGPLVNVFTGAIRNLGDGSAYVQLRGVYDWREDAQLIAGVDVPAGDRGDEYGGVSVPGTGGWSTPGRSAWLRAAYYF